MISGMVYTVMLSAKVLPRHMRLPPKKGQKEYGFLGDPSGLRNILDVGSNLSGSYFYG
jgi:hypothetical protein